MTKSQLIKHKTEHAMQCSVIKWANAMMSNYPVLWLLHAIPNGGRRHIKVAKEMKAEGAKSGVPDLCLPHARGDYHGLYIEMKMPGKKPSKAQVKWITALRKQNYCVNVCHSANDAINLIEQYIK